MNYDDDIYSTTRIKKLNVSLKEEEDIQFDRTPPKKAPVVRKPRPTYNRQSIPNVEEPSTPNQSRAIDNRRVSKINRPNPNANYTYNPQKKNYRDHLIDDFYNDDYSHSYRRPVQEKKPEKKSGFRIFAGFNIIILIILIAIIIALILYFKNL